MHKLCLLAALCSPFAHAEVVSVEANSMMRLPANASALRLEKLDVADYGTLLIPAGITRVEIDQLHLGREARITIVPAERGIELRVARADLGEGSQINARGASGTFEKPARPARDLNLRIESLQAPQLSIDARGGTGAPGFAGLDGGNGEEPGCTWGAAGSGANGDNGGNWQPGAAGGHGVARAAKGILVTTEPKHAARGTMKDMSEELRRLANAKDQHLLIAELAQKNGAREANDNQSDIAALLKTQYDDIKGRDSCTEISPELAQPHLLLSSAAGFVTTAAVLVVVFAFGHRVIDVDRRDHQLAFGQHVQQTVNTGGGFFSHAVDLFQHGRVFLVQQLGQVAAVVEDHVGGTASMSGAALRGWVWQLH